ncbi:MAG TPA: T9SS type A sorting domain-containing protein [candidate division Zixibacteria bacterium]|nr:T9SS type A sorting domain-containing protein [candidate division Zixibacteria bacterium]
MQKHIILGLGFVLLFSLILPGCEDNGLAPYEPEINNALDNFQFQATGMTDVDYSEAFVWVNSGDSATVDQSPSEGLSGTATLIIFDADGTRVYSGDLSDDGTFNTAAGTSGNWIIRVNFANVTGTVNFRVQMAD